MRYSRRIHRARLARRTTTAILALTFGTVSAFVVGAGAQADPIASTRTDLAAARAQLDSLNQHLSLLIEQYDRAGVDLHTTQTRLDVARGVVATTRAEATRLRQILSQRAAAAYEGGVGSQLEVVLGATSFQDFTERVEFVHSVVQSDAQLAGQAQAARERAEQAQASLAVLVRERAATVARIGQKKTEIETGIAQQQTLVDQLSTQLAQQEAAQRAAALKASARSGTVGGSSGGTGGTGGGGGPGPSPQPSPHPSPSPSQGGGGGGGGGPAPDPRAPTAVSAAFSAIGVPYVWGGSNPQQGFDCSGLTMWSWAQAGVSLPHSSALQYTVVPHVDRADLMPGDLLFFYTPISHVSMYVGGGMNIEALHPGSNVLEDAVDWPHFVGAGRP